MLKGVFRVEIPVIKRVLERNEMVAEEVRRILDDSSTVMLNFIGGPGAGKTTLLEATIRMLPDYKVAVIEGDITTTTDSERIKKLNVPVVQIETEGSCHLESLWVKRALEKIDLRDVDFVFVENVGNLVCPTEFDLGEHAKIGVLSVTEGDDKPRKYPLLFRLAKAVLLTKVDMLPYFNFNEDRFLSDIRKIKDIPVFKVNSLTGDGIANWVEWLRSFR